MIKVWHALECGPFFIDITPHIFTIATPCDMSSSLMVFFSSAPNLPVKCFLVDFNIMIRTFKLGWKWMKFISSGVWEGQIAALAVSTNPLLNKNSFIAPSQCETVLVTFTEKNKQPLRQKNNCTQIQTDQRIQQNANTIMTSAPMKPNRKTLPASKGWATGGSCDKMQSDWKSWCFTTRCPQ